MILLYRFHLVDIYRLAFEVEEVAQEDRASSLAVDHEM
jgi:hypothetical protein